MGENQNAAQISRLNQSEFDWIAQLLSSLDRLQVKLSSSSISHFFAQQHKIWDLKPNKSDPNTLINMIGAGLGELLCAEFGMEWKIVSDEHGTELAVVGQPGNIVVFPMNAVAKRWTGENKGTIDELVVGVAAIHREVNKDV